MDLLGFPGMFLLLIGLEGNGGLGIKNITDVTNNTKYGISRLSPSSTSWSPLSGPTTNFFAPTLNIPTQNATIHLSSTKTLTVLPKSSSPPTSLANPTTRKSTTVKKPGFCERYGRKPCRNILNESWKQYNETERYFDSKHGVNGSVHLLSLLLTESVRQISDQPRCKRLIEVALCQYTLPPCKDNLPITFCREDCERLAEQCKGPLNRIIGSASILADINGYDLKVLPTNCSAYPPGRTGNESCVYLGLFDHSKSENSKTNQDILWISIGAASALLILFMITISCVIKKRKIRQKEKLEFEEIQLRQTNIALDRQTSMKKRLSQALSMHSLSDKIAEMYDPSKLKQFSLDSIEYISDLGEGQFGLVFQGKATGIDERKDASEDTVVAVKTLKKGCNESRKDEFDQEVAFMSVLDHINVVKLLAVATEEEPYCMIFEFMEFGDLNQFLRKVKPIDGSKVVPEFELRVEDFLSICQQVASGMSYLASLQFVHRDLATRNCLVGKEMVVKIADFGLARDIYSSDYYKVRGDAMLPVRWMPPEAILHGKFTIKSDVYSYGILMWEVFTYALQPYYGYTNEEVITFAKQGVLLGQPNDCPDHIYKLMLDCWNRTWERRPDFTTIIKRLVKEPPPVSHYCTPRRLSTTPEGNATSNEPIGKIPVSMPVKPTNDYFSSKAVINAGFLMDQGESSEERS